MAVLAVLSEKHARIVSDYLTSLRDPRSMVDHDEVERLNKQLSDESDLVMRLGLQQALINASQPDLRSLEDSFVEIASTVCETLGVTPDALMAEGVPLAVVRRAGLVKGKGKGGKKAVSPRRRRVTQEEVLAVVSAMHEGALFTTRELAEATGAHLGMARKVIIRAQAEGTVVKSSIVESGRPGRDPVAYERV